MTRHSLIIGGLAAAVAIAAAVIAPRAAHGDAAGAATGQATPTPGHSHLPGGQCFRIRDIKNWIAPNPRTLYLRVMTNRYYRVDMLRDCPPLAWRNPLLVTTTVGSGWVCSPLDWRMSVSTWPGDVPQTCLIQDITRLTKQQADALPKAEKP